MKSIIRKDIAGRLKAVLGEDRKQGQTSWGTRLGFTTGTTSRLFKGEKDLTSSELLLIQQTENVRADWLLDGRGPPYSVDRRESDTELAAQLRIMLADEPDWLLHLVTAEDRYAIVLTMPASVQLPKGKEVVYTEVVVLAYPCFRHTLEVATGARQIKIVEITTDDMSRLQQGYAGTYELVGQEGAPGMLQHGRNATAREVLKLAEQTALGPPSIAEQRLMQHVQDNRALYSAIAEMSDERREALGELLGLSRSKEK